MKTGTFAISIGKQKRYSRPRGNGSAWRLQLWRITVTWIEVEFGEIQDWLEEVDSCESLVEKRTSEVGAWN